MLDGEAIDRALAAMGHFTDMAIPEFVGHSSGVATTCLAAAQVLSFDSADTHDRSSGGVGARPGTGHGSGPHLEQERIVDTGRLGANQAARLPHRADPDPVPVPLRHWSPPPGFIMSVSTGRVITGVSGRRPWSRPARLLAAADAYHAMTEPRPHRPALSREAAADVLAEEAKAGTPRSGSGRCGVGGRRASHCFGALACGT